MNEIDCPACGKKCYRSKHTARQASRNADGGRFRVYRCGSWWHLTTQNPDLDARLARKRAMRSQKVA